MAAPTPASWTVAMGVIGRCFVTTVRLICTRRLHQPRDNVGRIVDFADGTHTTVYRETTRDVSGATEPVTLVVCFRLRWVRGNRLAHWLFRAESLANTPLFAGFDGFVTKLWMTNDEHNIYRGVYDWDGHERAVAYVRALWWPLMVVSQRQSIAFHIIDGQHRDDVLRGDAGEAETAWWSGRMRPGC
ncbi:hypothetical protein QSJ18_04440 [Gordonia sp. ABSL1-1]|uniref:hypothetical protein n=1 Tax=Gordonia sp. ABSL1-1 TaxID=3053923 RepID=UPI00257302D3|nr:hypothetical protein [Gordonia sp. ABSL1-1]MDL9935987.1 hypothetical protein [Gordonia sp. ABSL1-1]